ncbi:MAG: transketolase [Pseudomonadota bacterium]|nr:transketolase [Pseudomonadota bacterium]
MNTSTSSLHDQHQRAANTLRALAMDMIQASGRGHVGSCLGFADVLTVLWREHMNLAPLNPGWINRDRLVCSNGHIAASVYAMLHLSGFEVNINDLKSFRQHQGRLSTHMVRDPNLGVDMSTGPLGQGIANGVGLAMARDYTASRYNQHEHTWIDHTVFITAGDGDMMEGLSHEAGALAGQLNLSKLILCYDQNHTIVGGDSRFLSEQDPAKRFTAYGWYVIDRVDGHDHQAISASLAHAKAIDRPVLIIFNTSIGRGLMSSDGENLHCTSLSSYACRQFKRDHTLCLKPFEVSKDVYDLWRVETYKHKRWQKQLVDYKQAFPVAYQAMVRWLAKDNTQPNQHYQNKTFMYHTESTKQVSLRKHSQRLLEAYINQYSNLIMGSADLIESTGLPSIHGRLWQPEKPNSLINYGVREFGAFSIANGMAAYAGLIPIVSTFLAFVEYGLSSIRMASLMKLQVIYVLTHDSVGVGEDGATHQPVEQLSYLRATPGLEVWRPCSLAELNLAWEAMLNHTDGPSVLVLPRQSIISPRAILEPNSKGGAYLAYGQVKQSSLDGLILATGSEVSLAIEISEHLKSDHIQVAVISMPCIERFFQTESYIKVLLAKQLPTLIIEAATAHSWVRFNHQNCAFLVMDQFGRSGCGHKLYQEYGFTPERGVEIMISCIQSYKQHLTSKRPC